MALIHESIFIIPSMYLYKCTYVNTNVKTPL